MTRSIEEIKESLRIANALVAELRIELDAARQQAHNIKPGDVVRVAVDLTARRRPQYPAPGDYRITAIEWWGSHGSKPVVWGTKRKKDGGWGLRAVYVGDVWTKVPS